MPETPDFDQIALNLVVRTFVELDVIRPGQSHALAQVAVAEQLKRIWNARGAADNRAVELRLSQLVGWIGTEPYRQQLGEAITALDR